jgi:transposase-like protein
MLFTSDGMRGRKRSLKDYPPCDTCGSSDSVVGYGKRVNTYGSKQTYYCKACQHKFTPDNGYKGRRFPPEVIKSAIRFSKDGLTLKQVVKEIENHYGVRVGESTVHDWIKTYGKSTSAESGRE